MKNINILNEKIKLSAYSQKTKFFFVTDDRCVEPNNFEVKSSIDFSNRQDCESFLQMIQKILYSPLVKSIASPVSIERCAASPTMTALIPSCRLTSTDCLPRKTRANFSCW